MTKPFDYSRLSESGTKLVHELTQMMGETEPSELQGETREERLAALKSRVVQSTTATNADWSAHDNSDHIPNAETQAAMAEAESGTLQSFSTVEEMMDELDAEGRLELVPNYESEAFKMAMDAIENGTRVSTKGLSREEVRQLLFPKKDGK